MVEFRKPKFSFDDDSSDHLIDSNNNSKEDTDSIVDGSSNNHKFRPIKLPGSFVNDSGSVSEKDSDVVVSSESSDNSSSSVSGSFNPLLDEEDENINENESSVSNNSDSTLNVSFNDFVDDSFDESNDTVDDSWDSFDSEFFEDFIGEDGGSVSDDVDSVNVNYSSVGKSSGRDFVINTDAVSRGVQDRESFVGEDDSDDEGEAFVGFNKIDEGSEDSLSTPVPLSSVVSDSFNPLLDEEDEIVPVIGSGEKDSVGDTIVDSDDKISGARGAVVEGTEFESLLSDGDAERLSVFQESKVAGREKSRAVNEKLKKERERKNGAKRGPRAIDSDFKRKPVREVIVGDDGVLSSDNDSLVDEFGNSLSNDSGSDSLGVSEISDGVGSVGVDSSAKSSVVGGSRERYRYLSSDGRVNVAELEFFKNLGGSRSAVLGDDSLVSSLRGGSDGLGESESERKARVVLYEQALRGKDGLKRGSRSSFNSKDRETLQFLAMFRYATDAQLARMFSCSVQTSYNRLKKLRSVGLVIDRKIYGARPIWFLTEPGLLLSGFDLPRVTESKLTFSMFPHQFTVNNTAANLWGANVNVLNLPDFPSRNRVNDKGEKVFGEELASELEIQSAFGKIKMFDKSDVYRPELMAEIDKQFKAWERAGGSEFGVSPEQVLGNEYMWALMPPFNIRLAYHVPDLIVKRPRNADGSPESIAVEIEINNKSSQSYEKTLRAYRDDNRLYKKVVWVCKNVGPARKLEQVAKEIGLWQEGRIDIVPVITENGVFKERDLWMI